MNKPKNNWVLKYIIIRKLILSLVFVLVAGSTLMNATSNNDEISQTTKEAVEDFGRASDCIWGARQLSLAISEDQTDRGEGGELMKNSIKCACQIHNSRNK
jgi:hypothetical protein